MTDFPIWIPGIPIPQGSKVATRTGHMREANPKLRPWRNTMHDHLTAWQATFMGAFERFDGPLLVDVTFHIPKPKKSMFDMPATPADLDKLCRALGDALTQSSTIKDDSRITTWLARKRYNDTPGITIHAIREDTP
ncbi:TPA: RusA family crossover junction endodeoxyribonuclease [Shigella flexneri]|nr:RusA family crossover junction endodeoxyribonuclease [Shigella flexneri]